MTFHKYERRNVGDPHSLWHAMCGQCNTVFHGSTEESVLSNLRAHEDGRCPELQRVNKRFGMDPSEYQR